jgi:tRNA (adenine37-N6)-methyltransferase
VSEVDNKLRPGEVAVELLPQIAAGVFFIGTIRTPWRTRRDCPKRGSPEGPVCSIVVDECWRGALMGLDGYRRIQVLYWMHQARRDLVLQTPFGSETTGTFSLRSPVRPNPIASSIVELVAIDGTTLQDDITGPRPRLCRRHAAARPQAGLPDGKRRTLTNPQI